MFDWLTSRIQWGSGIHKMRISCCNSIWTIFGCKLRHRYFGRLKVKQWKKVEAIIFCIHVVQNKLDGCSIKYRKLAKQTAWLVNLVADMISNSSDCFCGENHATVAPCISKVRDQEAAKIKLSLICSRTHSLPSMNIIYLLQPEIHVLMTPTRCSNYIHANKIINVMSSRLTSYKLMPKFYCLKIQFWWVTHRCS